RGILPPASVRERGGTGAVDRFGRVRQASQGSGAPDRAGRAAGAGGARDVVHAPGAPDRGPSAAVEDGVRHVVRALPADRAAVVSPGPPFAASARGPGGVVDAVRGEPRL